MFIYGIILGLFSLSCLLISSEKQIDKEQKERDEHAQEYRDITAALGAHFEPKVNNIPTTSSSLTQALQQKDRKAKL